MDGPAITEPGADEASPPGTGQLWLIARSLAPMLAYYVADWLWGLRAGIVISALWSMGEVALHLIQKKPLDGVFKLTAATTLVFGGVDLICTRPWLISYEPVVTNAMSAGLLVVLVRGSLAPFFEQIYRARPDLRDDPGVPVRIRLALWVMVAVAVLKVPLYLVMAWRLPVERAMNLRMVVGNLSLAATFGIVRFGLEPMIRVGRRLGWTQAV